MGENCATGVAFTRNPSTGEREFFGEYLINAQGEDVVAGTRTPQNLILMNKSMPKIFQQLKKIFKLLEKKYKDMQDILLQLQSELHKTVVFITHDLDEALKIGDRIAILKDGKMDQDDLPADILLNPKTEYVKKFVEDVNRSRVLKAKHIMQKLNGEDITKAIKVNENDFIEKFIDRVVEEKPEMIVVQDKQNKNVGYISSKRLSEILKK